MPPALKPGDTIGITCPAGYVSHERVAYAVEMLQQWGYRVVLGKTVGAEHHYFSGTDEARLADLQQMLDDPNIKAVLMGRGGYGVSRIIDALDFTRFQQSPKWICGFSDITVLHSHISARFGIASLHSPMCGAFKPETVDGNNIQSLRKVLLGEASQYSFASSTYNRAGVAEGITTGGNLAILAHLTGSRARR